MRWTLHAERRAAALAIARADVEQLVLAGHGRRIANHRRGRGRWRLVGPRWTVVYDHPDGGEWLVAAIVTTWRTG